MTTLLLVRHAIAEERELAAAAGIPDHLRPLTRRGEKRMARIAAALARQLEPPELIASSPLRRAVQTAEILAREWKAATPLETDTLAPGAPPEALARFLAQQRLTTGAVLVGHEPDLGQWAAWALTGTTQSFIPFKKGGAALIRFPGLPAAGQGQLLWLLTPAQLRARE